MTLLTHQVLSYKYTKKYYRQLRDAVSIFIYKFPMFCRGYDEDDRGNFLLFMQHKISGIINRFDYYNVTFEGYLMKILHWQIKDYARHRIIKTAKRYSEFFMHYHEAESEYVYCHNTNALFVGEPEPLSLTIKNRMPINKNSKISINKNGIITDRVLARRIILLTMKTCIWLDENQLQSIAYATGYRIGWLRSACHRLNMIVWERRRHFELLCQRRNSLFLKIIGLQNDLQNDVLSDKHPAIAERLHRARLRFNRLIQQINGTHRYPTNYEVSRELNIPKGTVDSGLFYVRRQMGLERGDIVAENNMPKDTTPLDAAVSVKPYLR